VWLLAIPARAQDPVRPVKGVIRLDGMPPLPQEYPLDEAIRRATGEEGYVEETWIVGDDNGLANCVVTLTCKDPAKKPATTPLEQAILDKIGVRYVPHVLVMTPETSVVFRNKESPCLGFHMAGRRHAEHSVSVMVPQGQEHAVTLKGRDTCSITCPVRPYTKGYLVVVDTPYFAVTDSDGRFEIEGVPQGQYGVSVWHEGAGKLPAEAGPTEVQIVAGEGAELTYVVKPPESR
jgi:hypothetical protein